MDNLSLRIKDDEHINHDPQYPTDKDFKLYTMDLSYFSGKLEMYLRFKEIFFERIEPHAEEFESILYKNTGSEQLPQLYDCRKHIDNDKRWLRDTTPIIEYLESDPLISKNSLSVLPECEVQKFFQFLFEDYADEYLWRPAMFWRWEPTFDRQKMGLRFYWEFCRTSQWRYAFVPGFLRPHAASMRQWLLSSYGEDCTTKEKKDVVVNQYYELLDVLEGILQKQPYLFGNHPTLVDFGFAGPFFRHFSSDETPRKIMQQRAPGVYEWIARLWNCKNSKLDLDNHGFPKTNELPESWDNLLKLLPDYMQYYRKNTTAYLDGKKQFSWINKGQIFNVPVVPYRVWCRKKLHEKYFKCNLRSQEIIKNILMKYECWWDFTTEKRIEIDPECGAEPPFSAPPEKRISRLSYKWDPTNVFTSYFLKTGFTTLGYIGAIAAGFLILQRIKKCN